MAALWVLALMGPLSARATAPQTSVTPRVFIVGGGPEKAYNQVAIESNVRYLGRLLPHNTTKTILFADGNSRNATVLYDVDRKIPAGEQLLSAILSGRQGDGDDTSRFRAPNVGGHIDGASRKPDIRRVFAQLGDEFQSSPTTPLLLYFTGHGSSNWGNLDNNYYDLWGGNETLSVKELAQNIAELPEQTPVTIVMVQCFSGAFGNLIFEGGDPTQNPVHRRLAGFFATVRERVAAGCTSAVNEADYHDFTSYFFAALTGRTRMGQRVTGADYNGDGRVSMDEAFCYTLIHDESIDVPVCTSDVFLRRYFRDPDEETFQAPYSSVVSWATPAQRAALEALSNRLQVTGEDRLSVIYHKFFGQPQSNGTGKIRDTSRQFDTVREEAKRALLRRWPALDDPDSSEGRVAKREAAAYLETHGNDNPYAPVIRLANQMDDAESTRERSEIAGSFQLRYIRLGKSVILAHRLRTGPDSPVKARFEQLIADESGAPIPSVDTLESTRLSASPQRDPSTPATIRTTAPPIPVALTPVPAVICH